MNRPKLLYISINDGSDTRINKEIKTLSPYFDIYYLGIGKNEDKSFIRDYCRSFNIVQGHHKSLASLSKYYLLVVKTFFAHRFQSIHVINEQLLLLFYPYLIKNRKYVVLDIFDSIFLRANQKYETLKKIVYKLPRTIIVTDENRKSLLPTEFKDKTIVVENYPYQFKESVQKTSQPNELIIFYNGSMSKIRGTEMLFELLEIESRLKLKMAGWVYDNRTKQLSEHHQVEFLGVVSQQESMHIAAQCDYILSLYEPINENNINASPNKIYDAIQAKTPVIINKEVKIARFVEEHKIGYVIKSFYDKDYKQLIDYLFLHKNTYSFNGNIQKQYTWEAVEEKLVEAHKK